MTVGPKIAEAMTQRGVIARAMPEANTIGFAPPLCITPDEITIVAQTLRAAADDVLSS
jgi:L-2,4-diaminobutyrate transaminase